MISFLLLIGVLIGICSIYIIVNNLEMSDINNYIVSFISIIVQLYILFIDKFTTNYQGVLCGALVVVFIYILISFKIKNETIKNHQNYLVAVLSFVFLIFCGVLTYETLQFWNSYNSRM